MRLSQEAIRRMTEGRGGSGGGGGSFDPSLLAGMASQAWVEEGYISKAFWAELFIIHKKVTTVVMNGETEVSRTVDTSGVFTPNETPGSTSTTDPETGYVTTVTTEISSIESKKGFWTNYFISALGLNSEGGGGGLTLNEPLATINVSGLANHPSSSGQTIVWNGYAWVYGTAGGGTGTVTGVKVDDITYSPVNGIVSLPDYPSTMAWSAITSKPTTIEGYGITDAKIENGVITLGSNTITPLTSSAITDMATKTWVNDQHFVDYVGETDVDFNFTDGHDLGGGVYQLHTRKTQTNKPMDYGILVDLESVNGHLQFAAGTNDIRVRSYWWTNNPDWSAYPVWKTIAFTDSSISGNAGSATKLQTARSLWGNSFDGTADVTGNITVTGVAGNHSVVGIQGSTYYLQLAIGSGNTNRGLFEGKSDINKWLLYFDASNTILNYGNVGIGNTSPSHKLDVTGDARITTDLTVGSSYLNSTYLRVGALSYAYHIAMGAGSSYVWFDCRNASDTVANAFQLYPDYTNFSKPIKTNRLYLYKPNASNDTNAVYLEYESANSGIHIVGGGLYADTYVSALGLSDSGGGGVSLLSELSDVQLSSPSNGQALIYDSTLGKWKNGAAGMNMSELTTYLSSKILTVKNGTATLGTWNPTAAGTIDIASAMAGYLPLTGGTLTGGVNMKFDHDLTKGDNGITSTQWYGVRVLDKNGYLSAQFLNQVQTDGTNALNLNLRNRNGGTEHDKSLMVYLTKSGVISAALNGVFTATSFNSTVSTGTSPLTVASTTVVSNLNADLLDGYHANNVFQAAVQSMANANTSMTNMLLATITLSNSDSLEVGGFSAVFNSREMIGKNGFFLNLSIRRTDRTTIGCDFHYIPLGTVMPEVPYVRSDDGATFYVYMPSSGTGWRSYYAVTKINAENCSFNLETTDSVISGTRLNATAVIGGAVSSAAKLHTARSLWGNSFDGTADVTGNITVTGVAGNHSMVGIQGSTYYLQLAIGGGNTNRGLFEGKSDINKWLLYFDASNTILNYGNVGIGTSNPTYKLDVSGTAHTTGDITIGTSSAASKLIVYGAQVTDDSKGIFLRASDDTNRAYFTWNGNIASSDYLNIHTGFGNICLTPAYNVGVGTTSPSYKLDVNGTINCTSIRIGGYTITAENGGLHINSAGLYADTYISALGLSSSGSGSVSSLSDLIDVSISSASNGQALVYRNGFWKNETVQSSGGTVTSVATGTGLTGGTITSSGTISINSTYQNYINHGESAYNSLSSYLPLSAGSTKPLTGSLYLNGRGMGIFEPYSSVNIPLIYDNGENLWIGATQTATTHHTGQTYISAGYNGTSGNSTINICVPNANNTGGTNYGVLHSGNYTELVYSKSQSDNRYLQLSGGTMTGTLKVATGKGIEDATGNGLLVYHPTNWSGVSASQWGAGAVDCQGVIRSDANDLKHYRGGTLYNILDTYNSGIVDGHKVKLNGTSIDVPVAYTMPTPGTFTSGYWHKLGDYVTAGDGANLVLNIYDGNGYNAQAEQNSFLRVVIKDGWQSTRAAANSVGVTIERFGVWAADMQISIVATDHNAGAVWIYFPWQYADGTYEVSGQYTSWTHNSSTTSDTTTAPTTNQTKNSTGNHSYLYFDNAYTNSNVASATKLQTARLIWGQSFNGTADVTGSIYFPNNAAIYFKDTSAANKNVISFNSSNNLVIGWDVRTSSNTFITGNTVELTRNGGSSGVGIHLDSSNNVGIGTNTPGAKLDVIGQLRSTTFLSCHNAVGTNGTAGWICFAIVAVSSAWATQPLKFKITQRGRVGGEITLRFAAASAAADTTVEEFSYTGNIMAARVVRNGANFSLYIQKHEEYDNIAVSLLNLGTYMSSKVTVTWQNTLSSSDPGGTAATCRYYFSNRAYMEWDETNNAVHFVNAGVYSDSFVSALGLNGSGGGGATLNTLLTSLNSTSLDPANVSNKVLVNSNGTWTWQDYSSGGGISLNEPLSSINGSGIGKPSSGTMADYAIVWTGTGWGYKYVPDNGGGGGGSGTVTSIKITVPTGFSINPTSAITTSGTFAISFASGYSLPTTAKQSNWDTAYNNNHIHSNKNVLDDITSTKVSNWDTAYADHHTHANMSFLNSLTSISGTFWGRSWTNGGTVSGNMENVGTIYMTGHLIMDAGSDGIYLNNDGTGIDWHNSSNQYVSSLLAFTQTRVHVSASGGLRIGDGLLVWDSTNKAIKVQRISGNDVVAGDLYATGGLSALGMSAGVSSIDAMTFGNLKVNNTLTFGNNYASLYMDDFFYIDSSVNISVNGVECEDSNAHVKRLYLDPSRYIYVSSGKLYYYNGSSAKEIAFTN